MYLCMLEFAWLQVCVVACVRWFVSVCMHVCVPTCVHVSVCLRLCVLLGHGMAKMPTEFRHPSLRYHVYTWYTVLIWKTTQ